MPLDGFNGLVSFDDTNMNVNEVIAALVTRRNQDTGSPGAIDDNKWRLHIKAWR
jgi:fumarate hydratase class II